MPSPYAEFEAMCHDLALHLDALEFEAWLDFLESNAVDSFV